MTGFPQRANLLCGSTKPLRSRDPWLWRVHEAEESVSTRYLGLHGVAALDIAAGSITVTIFTAASSTPALIRWQAPSPVMCR